MCFSNFLETKKHASLDWFISISEDSLTSFAFHWPRSKDKDCPLLSSGISFYSNPTKKMKQFNEHWIMYTPCKIIEAFVYHTLNKIVLNISKHKSL